MRKSWGCKTGGSDANLLVKTHTTVQEKGEFYCIYILKTFKMQLCKDHGHWTNL